MSDKPLYVQVAEALGWVNIECCKVDNNWWGHSKPVKNWPRIPIPRFDKDWKDTGPLIEKHGINLSFNGEHWFSDANDSEGTPSCYHLGPSSGFLPCDDQADTPLVSVCKTLLVMKERGQL